MSTYKKYAYPFFAWALLTFTIFRVYIGLYLSKSKSFPSSGEMIEASSQEYYNEFILPKNEPIIELNQQLQNKPQLPPFLSNMRSIDESKLPYKCGVILFYHIACTGGSSINHWFGKQVKLILFYHIACTGGSSINHWFGKQVKLNGPNTSYWTKWGRKEKMEANFIKGMTNQTQHIGPNEWRVVHAHGMSLFPNASEAYLHQWREEIESQGCAFVVTTMLRDAIGHTISQSKGMIKPNLTLDEFLSHLEPQNYNERGHFVTQLDYLLYNMGPRNVYNATKEEKVRRAIEILQRHFDVLLLSDYDRFTDIIHKMTGWFPRNIRESNVFQGDLNYSYADLQKIKSLTEANGDVMFIDA
ncbi:hypothetical protein ACHAWC_004572, partial [Mediolabrus comicus]